MAMNKIPDSYDDVMSLAVQCIAGAGTVGPGIPLVLNTQAAITTSRTDLSNGQATYKQNCAAMKGLYEEYHAQLDTVYTWCQRTRDYLKQYLGSTFNQAWVEAGFNNSIAVEEHDAFLGTLLGTLRPNASQRESSRPICCFNSAHNPLRRARIASNAASRVALLAA